MEDNENLPPMTAQARYIHNLIKNLSPKDIATLVAEPRGNRSSQMNCADINAMVNKYGPDHVKAVWADKLADAADVARDPEWEIDWATPIAKMLGVEVQKESPQRGGKKPDAVRSIDRAAA